MYNKTTKTWSWTLEEISEQGYDTNNIKVVQSPGHCYMRLFAIENDIDLADVHGFRLESGEWILCHKVNPKKGFIDYPVLGF